MAHINIDRLKPLTSPTPVTYVNWQNMRICTGLKFEARQVCGHRFAFDEHRLRSLVYDPGTDEARHLALAQTPDNAPSISRNTSAFFAQKGIDKGRYVLGIFREGADGNLTMPTRWRSISWSDSLKLTLTGGTDKVIEQTVEGRDVVLTRVTGRYRIKLDNVKKVGHEDEPGDAMATLRMYMQYCQEAQIVRENGLTILRATYSARIPDGMSPPTTIDYDISHISLPELDQIYQNSGNRHFTVKLYTHGLDRKTVRRNTDGSTLQGDKNDVMTHGARNVCLEFCTCEPLSERTRLKNIVPEGAAMPAGARVSVIRARSILRVEHLDDANGRDGRTTNERGEVEAGDIEWIPFDQKVPGPLDLVRYHPDQDSPWGSKFEDGKYLMGLAGQLFGPAVRREIYENEREYGYQAPWWATPDQGGFFDSEMDGELSSPNGPIANCAQEWWLNVRSAASMMAAKTQAGDALCTGSNYDAIAAWLQGLFPQEVLGFKHLFWGTLIHPNTITEDAQLASEQTDMFGREVKYVRDAKSIGASITTHKQCAVQRARWDAMIGFFLAWGFIYLRDEVIRCQLFGALSRITFGLTDKYCRHIPSRFSFRKFMQRLLTSSWYLDAPAKFGIVFMSLSFIFFGFTPIIAGGAFLPIWALLTLPNWTSFANQMTKAGMNPKHTLPPAPRYIWMWQLYVPRTMRSVLHVMDVAVGPFMQTFQQKGKGFFSWEKKQLFWCGSASAVGSLYGFYQLLQPMGLADAEALPTLGLAFAPLAAGLALRYFWDRWLSSFFGLPNSRHRNRLHSAIDFVAREAVMLGLPTYYAVKTLAGAAEEGFDQGMFINSFWSGFNAVGFMTAIKAYLMEQKYHRREDTAARERALAEGNAEEAARLLIELNGTDTTGSFFYQATGADLVRAAAGKIAGEIDLLKISVKSISKGISDRLWGGS